MGGFLHGWYAMTFFKEPRPLTPEEEIERDKTLYFDYLDGLWQEFFFTGDLEKLAEFVKKGGDIDEFGLREAIAEMIMAEPVKNPGGAIDHINIAFYMAVCGRMNSFRIKTVKGEPASETSVDPLSLSEQKSQLEHVKKTPAINALAEEWGIERPTAWTRYEKGKKLFIQNFGRTWN